MQICLQQFQGPLDLLLTLIQKQKLDISKISLSKIADQYLKFIDENQNIPFNKLLDFLSLASQLIILKTRTLLPYLSIDDENESEDNLIIKLQNYQLYLSLAKKLQNRLESLQCQCFSRLSKSINFKIDESCLSLHLLQKTAARLLKQRIPPMPVTALKKIFNIEEKIKQINDYLKQKTSCLFSDLIEQQSSKIEIIISFLALLELSKAGFVFISQRKIFEEIIIMKHGT
ncbi:MAG: segregation/condensation protein A [Candidatus Jacksonbacteria bacterium]